MTKTKEDLMSTAPIIEFPFVGIVVLLYFLYAAYLFIVWFNKGGMN